MAVQACPEQLAEVTLGPLIGRGEHGRVYRGWWRATRVAVKASCGTARCNALGHAHGALALGFGWSSAPLDGCGMSTAASSFADH